MSADLFAEFGSGPGSGQHSQNARPQATSLIPDLEASDDDFFNFSGQNQATLQTTQTRTHSNKDTSIGGANTPEPFGSFSQPYDSNVLFDASLETVSNDGTDDWGEFESAETIPQEQPKTPLPEPKPSSMAKLRAGRLAQSKSPGKMPDLNLMDSLSIEDKTSPVKSQPTTSAPAKSRQVQRKSRPVAPAKPPEPLQDEPFEEWGDFIDGPPSPAPASAQRHKTSQRTDTSSQVEKSMSGVLSRSEPVPASQVRPTNIPPPSVLLELFLQLLEQLRQEAVSVKKNLQEKDQLEDAALLIIYTLKSAARVIAGRTLRWKRDTILSQSMRIGPARAGKAGGMKLNTVNKNEDIKEKQEAVDVVTMWRDRAAVFNSVIQAAKKRPITVIAENARVITATASQGAVKAPHACALCGLKRDERLPKIDENVEDSFGEWWTDHWGHTECKQFWERNMNLLGQR
ncbi:hypothetical protein ASPWEDRAFT_36706 [Aspergillus wentii DTO 134E9]|uniref:Uncharacterized protein n=1 Tax=Aspergillus wentii DTO 134E9 TaxID=1073089 RepID=A0A1L9RVP7_ASPWE|nr:uncharacterized protein ASPWEDRAFT_36706 [Aspergillus wentii DTO 134E9]KAI9923390.1 hypothetical protein MW887_009382 [Aspergillus wentii]OJJ38996.1 hypothetical protein ASPWEDRAFT_36706 [Aspergillus wentii DTO 134E9]